MTKNKNLKPIEIDAQFKYRCPDPKCGSEHWLFLHHVRAKGYVLACDCGNTYTISRISKVKAIFLRKKKKQDIDKQSDIEQCSNEIAEQQADYLNKACKILENYGFSHKEATSLVEKVYDLTKCEDPLLLVKDSLRIFGGI